MSATKGKKPSTSSSTPPTKLSTVSPKAGAPKAGGKTLLNYFTKVSKDKSENDLNESNRKRKLSAEANNQPPVKILKSSDVVTIDDEDNVSELLHPLEPVNLDEIDDESCGNNPNVEEETKKPILIKLTPKNKNKKEPKIKNDKRRSKGPKLEAAPIEVMDVDDDVVVEEPSEKLDQHVEETENKNVVNCDKDDKNSEVVEKSVAENTIELAKEDAKVPEIKQKTKEASKTPRRKSNRIEMSQEKAAEEKRIIAEKETNLSEAESKVINCEKPDADISSIKATIEDTESDDKIKEHKASSNDISLISDHNSEDELSLTLSPANKVNLPKLTASSEKKLSVKQQKYQETRRKIREEREKKLQEEREKQKKEREDQRKREREEKELKLKKEKAEKEEHRAKEREERERKRLEEIQQKNEEKRKRDEQKEEEKRKKEDERKKKEAEKEEEKREKEQERLKKEQEKLEEEQKKKREAEKFKRFFRNSLDQTNPGATSTAGGSISISSSQGNDASNPATETASNFMPFCVKGNMKLAPVTRKTLSDEQKERLEQIVNGKQLETPSVYLKALKSQNYVIGKSEKTISVAEDDDVMIVDDELGTIGDEVVELKPKQQKYRAKFLRFNGNRRPPYYGTWRKKSTIVRPCKPFEMDTKYFNYDVDSDDEWEDDEPGESLKGSDDDYESNDDYEVDNEFFVPHGYLSDEENKAELDGEGGVDIEENDNHPDTQKAKLKILQQEFFAEHSKKTEKIKPKLIGCIWQNLNGTVDDDRYPAIIHKLLENHAMIMAGPISLTPTEVQVADENQADSVVAIIEFTTEQIQDLIKLTHGNVHKRQFLVEEYLASRAANLGAGHKEKLTKIKITNKIREMAEWKRCVTDNTVMNNRYCWVVRAEQLQEYNLSNLDVLNAWKYTLKPLRTLPSSSSSSATTTKEDSNDGAPAVISSSTPVAGTVNSITKYTTPISKGEPITDNLTKPIASTSASATTTTTPIIKKVAPSQTAKTQSTTKKRVNLLMSVPRGQSIPQNIKNNLISEYLNNGRSKESSSSNVGKDDSDKDSKDTEQKVPKTKMEIVTDKTLSMDCDVIQLE